jgi:hypothetical protein
MSSRYSGILWANYGNFVRSRPARSPEPTSMKKVPALLLFTLVVSTACTTTGPVETEKADLVLSRLRRLAIEHQTDRPAAAAGALEFLARTEAATPADGPSRDALRAEAERWILALTASRTIRIRVKGPDGNALPYVLATMTGERGTPVRGLYDFRIDLDAEGRGVIGNVPPGEYSLRLFTIREFRSAEGFDLVDVHPLDLRETDAVVEADLEEGGRAFASLSGPARLSIRDADGRLVASTFWRGEQGGFTTEFLRLTPGFMSCVLPAGEYLVQAIRYREVVATGTVEIRAGVVTSVEFQEAAE